MQGFSYFWKVFKEVEQFHAKSNSPSTSWSTISDTSDTLLHLMCIQAARVQSIFRFTYSTKHHTSAPLESYVVSEADINTHDASSLLPYLLHNNFSVRDLNGRLLQAEGK
jgi:hypothetical protein